MNHFQPQHPNREENRQNNLPGKMLNNYFQPAPQHDNSNEFFTGGPNGETGGPGGYYQEQQPANHVPPQYGQQHPSPERIGGLFPGAPNGNGNGNGSPFPEFIEEQTEQLVDNILPEPPNNNGNGNGGNGGAFPNWPSAPSFPNFPENGDNGFPEPPNNNGNGNGGNGGAFPNWPPAPSFPNFPENGDNGFPEPPNNNGNGNGGNGGAFPNWPPAPSFPNFPENGDNGGSYEQQPSQAEMGGMNSQPPMGPPPNFVPQKQQMQTFAVDPGGIRHCLFRFTYIWPNRDRGFWAFPTFLGRNSIAGFRWNGFRWVYFGMDLNSIESFQCM